MLTHLGRRVDGVRIKHSVEMNSIKMYDKAAGQVLRVETTIQDTFPFKVFRPKEGDPDGEEVLPAAPQGRGRRAPPSRGEPGGECGALPGPPGKGT